MLKTRYTIALISAALAAVFYAAPLPAQEEQPQQPQEAQPAQAQPAQAQPAQAQPAQAEQAQAKPTPTEAQAEPAQTEPAQAEPAPEPAAEPPRNNVRNLWIAKYESEVKAAAAVASVQAATVNAMKYSNLFATVKTFESEAVQPEGAWTLTAKEIEFSGGSAAKRALVGFGSGRSKVTMEYTLYNPSRKPVWTKKITTKANFWGAATLGAAQDQSKAMDEQGQKLTDALAEFFTGGKTQ